MPAAKAAQKGGSRSKAAAARAEKNGNGAVKTTTFRGVDLILPDELGCEVAYAYADLEDAGQRVKPLLDFIESLIGHDAMERVKAAQIRDKVTFMDLAEDLMALIQQVYEQYGTDAGES